jgi:hypothetical protein
MNPGRHEVEHVLKDMRRLIENPKSAEEARALLACSQQLSGLADQLADKPDKVRMLVEMVTQLRASKVRSRRVVEERILDAMNRLVDRACANHDDAASAEVLRELYDFAKGCFSFKPARDAVSGRRRAVAFEILSAIGPMENSSEIVELAAQSINEAPAAEEVRAALEFLKSHIAETKAKPDDGLIDTVWGLIERADSESVLFGGLDALVEWGVISEFTALTCLDDWRDSQDLECESNE